MLSVAAGMPTAAELAALVVVLGARLSQPPAPAMLLPAPALWSSGLRRLRPQLFAGPGAWRASGLPG